MSKSYSDYIFSICAYVIHIIWCIILLLPLLVVDSERERLVGTDISLVVFAAATSVYVLYITYNIFNTMRYASARACVCVFVFIDRSYTYIICLCK